MLRPCVSTQMLGYDIRFVVKIQKTYHYYHIELVQTKNDNLKKCKLLKAFVYLNIDHATIAILLTYYL